MSVSFMLFVWVAIATIAIVILFKSVKFVPQNRHLLSNGSENTRKRWKRG